MVKSIFKLLWYNITQKTGLLSSLDLGNLYDNFIEVFIIVQTVVDMINDLPEIIIRKEFFDEIIDVVTLLGGDLNDAL